MNQLSIELADVRKIIESDFDDVAIRIKLGEFLLQKAVEQDEVVSKLLDVKIVTEVQNIPSELINTRCCRGRE